MPKRRNSQEAKPGRFFENRENDPAPLYHDLLPNRVQYDIGGIVKVQFLHQVSPMGLDGVGADVQQCRDFFV